MPIIQTSFNEQQTGKVNTDVKLPGFECVIFIRGNQNNAHSTGRILKRNCRNHGKGVKCAVNFSVSKICSDLRDIFSSLYNKATSELASLERGVEGMSKKEVPIRHCLTPEMLATNIPGNTSASERTNFCVTYLLSRSTPY
jgi:hypothetical protein